MSDTGDRVLECGFCSFPIVLTVEDAARDVQCAGCGARSVTWTGAHPR